jgi:hypothetical protein
LGGASNEVSQISQTFTVPSVAPYLRIRNVNAWKPLTIDLQAYTGAQVTVTLWTSTDADMSYSSFWADDIGFVQSKNQVLNYYLTSRVRSGSTSTLPISR